MTFLTRTAWNLFVSFQKNRLNTHRPAEVPDIADIHRVLAVSSTAIGDTLFTLPAIRALKKHIPHAQIDLLVRDRFLPLFSDIPEISDLIPYKGAYRNTFALLKHIRQKRYDICLVFHDSDPCPVQAAWLAGIPFILRIGQKDAHVADMLSARMPYTGREHAIEQRLELVRKITGASLEQEDDRKMMLPVSGTEATNYMIRICRERGTHCADKLKIGLQPGASGEYKRWPLRNFAGLALKLLKYSEQTVIFIMGSEKERRIGKRLEEAIIQAGGAAERVIDMTGKVEIGKLARFIKGLDLVITNDTGPLHIAIATGTPTISLFVPTNVHGTGPVQDLHMHKVIKKEKPCHDCVEKYCEKPHCMSLITVDDVFRAVVASPPFEQK